MTIRRNRPHMKNNERKTSCCLGDVTSICCYMIDDVLIYTSCLFSFVRNVVPTRVPQQKNRDQSKCEESRVFFQAMLSTIGLLETI